MTRLQQLRLRKADWDKREPCGACRGSGIEDDGEECLNCDGIGVVPTRSWEESNTEDAKELAWLEHQEGNPS